MESQLSLRKRGVEAGPKKNERVATITEVWQITENQKGENARKKKEKVVLKVGRQGSMKYLEREN